MKSTSENIFKTTMKSLWSCWFWVACCVWNVQAEFTHTYLPVVFWHGMGDTSKGSLVRIQKLVEDQLNNSVYTYSIQIGSNQEEDFMNSYFKHSNEQIELACDQLKNQPELSSGFNLIGFSQGGQFARALVQRCDLPRPLSLITLGGQHQGVFGLPRCTNSMCEYASKLIDYGAYESFVQGHLVQAQYWHDPLDQPKYVEKSQFLADINNERKPRNELYRSRIMSLERFVMVQFDQDTIVIPKESSLFGFFESGQAERIVPLEQTRLYTEDWLGLKHLEENHRLIRLHTKGNHLVIKDEWFIESIVKPFLID